MAGQDMSETGDDRAESVEQAAQSLLAMLVQAGGDQPSVSGAQLAALTVIARRAPLNMAQLAEELGTIPSWASRICDRLEADGYIERRLNQTGRRQVSIKLRPPGQRLLADLQDRRVAALSPVLQRMTAADRGALQQGLEAFARAADPATSADEQSA